MDLNQPVMWSPGVKLDQIEKQIILKAFQFYRGNKTATSNSLGISVRTLDNKLEKYEQEGRAERERQIHERTKQIDFLTRSRGQVPAQPSNAPIASTAEVSRPQTHSRARMEPAPQPAQKPTMPLPQRKEVQSVLPEQAASSGHRGRR